MKQEMHTVVVSVQEKEGREGRGGGRKGGVVLVK